MPILQAPPTSQPVTHRAAALARGDGSARAVAVSRNFSARAPALFGVTSLAYRSSASATVLRGHVDTAPASSSASRFVAHCDAADLVGKVIESRTPRRSTWARQPALTLVMYATARDSSRAPRGIAVRLCGILRDVMRRCA